MTCPNCEKYREALERLVVNARWHANRRNSVSMNTPNSGALTEAEELLAALSPPAKETAAEHFGRCGPFCEHVEHCPRCRDCYGNCGQHAKPGDDITWKAPVKELPSFNPIAAPHSNDGTPTHMPPAKADEPKHKHYKTIQQVNAEVTDPEVRAAMADEPKPCAMTTPPAKEPRWNYLIRESDFCPKCRRAMLELSTEKEPGIYECACDCDEVAVPAKTDESLCPHLNYGTCDKCMEGP